MDGFNARLSQFAYYRNNFEKMKKQDKKENKSKKKCE
jgi:hypothetical protein